jgi:hypothetical protein
VDFADRPEHFTRQIEEFQRLLTSTPLVGERQIINFVKSRGAYFIIGAILERGFLFGHHSCFIFPEFQLGTEYKADYLLVGTNSHGYHFVFVELEDHKGSVTLEDGEFGAVIRKGMSQVGRWRIWLAENFSSLRPIFEKALGRSHKTLPREFSVYDPSRCHFVVVAGRRDHYSDFTKRLQREEQTNFLTILHYDNLVDAAQTVQRRGNF